MTDIVSKPDYGSRVAEEKTGLLTNQFQVFFDDIEEKLNTLTLDCLDVYDNTGGQTITSTEITINLDVTRKSVGSSLSITSDIITANESGVYLVNFRVSAVLADSTRAVFKAFLHDGTSEIDGTACFTYCRLVGSDPTTAAAAMIWDATEGDTLLLKAIQFDGTEEFTTEVDGSGMTLVKIG